MYKHDDFWALNKIKLFLHCMEIMLTSTAFTSPWLSVRNIHNWTTHTHKIYRSYLCWASFLYIIVSGHPSCTKIIVLLCVSLQYKLDVYANEMNFHLSGRIHRLVIMLRFYANRSNIHILNNMKYVKTFMPLWNMLDFSASSNKYEQVIKFEFECEYAEIIDKIFEGNVWWKSIEHFIRHAINARNLCMVIMFDIKILLSTSISCTYLALDAEHRSNNLNLLLIFDVRWKR